MDFVHRLAWLTAAALDPLVVAVLISVVISSFILRRIFDQALESTISGGLYLLHFTFPAMVAIVLSCAWPIAREQTLLLVSQTDPMLRHACDASLAIMLALLIAFSRLGSSCCSALFEHLEESGRYLITRGTPLLRLSGPDAFELFGVMPTWLCLGGPAFLKSVVGVMFMQVHAVFLGGQTPPTHRTAAAPLRENPQRLVLLLYQAS